MAHRKDLARLIRLLENTIHNSIISFTSTLFLVSAQSIIIQTFSDLQNELLDWSSHFQALQIALEWSHHCPRDLLQRLCTWARQIDILRMAL